MEDFFGSLENGLGNAGQSRYLYPVAFISAALDDLAEEHHLFAPLRTATLKFFTRGSRPANSVSSW